MNMWPHCVQTPVGGPRGSGQDALTELRKKPACMCRAACFFKNVAEGRRQMSRSKRLQKLHVHWSASPARDGRFRLAGTSVCLWGKCISGPAATPSFYPLSRPP
jgi:hypothetical protein